MTVLTYLAVFVTSQMRQDIPFLLILVVLARLNLVTIEVPACVLRWLEPQDLAPLSESNWRQQ